MKPTFASEVGNAAVIPFVFVQNGAYVYPDMVKVKVALDNGDILSTTRWGSSRRTMHGSCRNLR